MLHEEDFGDIYRTPSVGCLGYCAV